MAKAVSTGLWNLLSTTTAQIADHRGGKAGDRKRAHDHGLMSLATDIEILFHDMVDRSVCGAAMGVRSQEESGATSDQKAPDPGAPAVPRLKHKLLWNTVVSAIVFMLWYLMYTYRLVSIEDLAALLGMSR